MPRNLGLISALTIFAFGGQAAGAAPVPAQSLERVLANCDPSTGLPRGVKARVEAGPRRSVIINPGPLSQPDAKTVAAAYPNAAKPTRVSGKVLMTCLVAVDGRTQDCQVVEETPPGLGFAEAALRLAGQMVFVPKRLNCVPVDGGNVSIPISFMPS